jgi:acetyl-CoA C-acetyltransferase
VHADLPIVVGVGQLTDRSDDLDAKREPLALVEDAVRRALRDAESPAVAQRIDSIRVVNMLSGSGYDDPAGGLAARLGVPPGERLYTTIGGNSPQWLVNKTADDLATGRVRAAVIAGGEALHTLRLAAKRRIDLAWTQGRGRPPMIGDDRQGSHPDEWRYGLQMPTQIYPLFEVALRAREGRTPQAHADRIARLSASLAAIASAHPDAWFRDGKTAEEIGTVSAANRMVAYPYCKYMTSIIDVDQAAAVIMTTVGEARRLGIPASRWVHVHGGGEATDIWHLKDRTDYHSSTGMADAFRQALTQAGVEADGIAALDLYSCFPSAPQIAARVLGVPSDGTRALSVTGGLPYFGGAGNNYALHAIVTMIERLRSTPEALGLVSALGWYLTKHAVGIYGMQPPSRSWHRPPAAPRELAGPPFLATVTGRASIETYTVLHDRDGEPHEAIFVLRSEDGTRTFGLSPDDRDLFAILERDEMVGTWGSVTPRPDGLNLFRPVGA